MLFTNQVSERFELTNQLAGRLQNWGNIRHFRFWRISHQHFLLRCLSLARLTLFSQEFFELQFLYKILLQKAHNQSRKSSKGWPLTNWSRTCLLQFCRDVIVTSFGARTKTASERQNKCKDCEWQEFRTYKSRQRIVRNGTSDTLLTTDFVWLFEAINVGSRNTVPQHSHFSGGLVLPAYRKLANQR